MIRLIVRTLILLLSSAIGLLVATYVVDGLHISWSSFLLVVAVFTILQSVLAPWLIKITHRNAPALLGAVGLISTLIALFLTSLISSGLTVDSLTDWALSALVIWLVTMLATLFVPLILVKLGVQSARERRAEA